MNIDKIVDVVKNGGIAIIPTDTVYGIIADATNEDVVKKVYDIKKRPYDKALLIMVSDNYMLSKYTAVETNLQRQLISRYWPGPMTLILTKKDELSDLLCGGLDNVGVRIPDDDDLRDIIRMVGKPCITTSANISGSATITSVDEIEEDLKKNVDYIEDAGKIIAKESTIVRAFDEKLEILREGQLTEDIKRDFGI